MNQMTKTTQYFSDEYLASCQSMSKEQICQFIEDFSLLHHSPKKIKSGPPSKLISLKVDIGLLADFRQRCDSKDLRYQTQIKKLMRQWCES